MSGYDTNTPYAVIDGYSDLEATPQAKTNVAALDYARQNAANNPANFYAGGIAEKNQPRGFNRGSWMFVVVVALVSALVIGGAVGGGLGASLASCENEKKSLQVQGLSTSSGSSSVVSANQLTVQVPTATATATDAKATTGLLANYAVLPAVNVYNVSIDCAEVAQKPITTLFNPIANQIYDVHCGVDFGNSAGKDSQGNEIPTRDLMGIISYDLGTCIEACSSINRFNDQNKVDATRNCRSVTFVTRIHESLSSQEANCFIKNGTPADIKTVTDPSAFFVLSAALQE